MKETLQKLIAVTLLAVLTACGQPLPEDRLDYAGVWQNDKVSLKITAEGHVDYERINNNGSVSTSKSVSAPLQEFEGNDFVVGLAFLTTKFEVTEPPHQINGSWQMVVDGERLTKIAL